MRHSARLSILLAAITLPLSGVGAAPSGKLLPRRPARPAKPAPRSEGYLQQSPASPLRSGEPVTPEPLAPNPAGPKAHKSALDVNAIVHETQKQSSSPDILRLVWWVPEEFWRASLENASLPDAEVESFLTELRPYTVVVVVDGLISPLGMSVYKPEAVVRHGVKIRGTDGTEYTPVPAGQVSEGAQAIANRLKPVFANLIGPMGKNMHIFFFPAKNAAGEPVVLAKGTGRFTVSVEGEEFTWRLPLGSISPAKVCPMCNERLLGSYSFCPYDGAKLP